MYLENNIRTNSLVGVGILASLALYSLSSTEAKLSIVGTTTNITSEQSVASVNLLREIHNDMTQDQVEAVFRKRLKLADKAEAPMLAEHLMKLAHTYRIEPSMILSVISAESNFHFTVRSHKSAVGIMQVRADTAKFVAKIYEIKSYKKAGDLKNPLVNMEIGVAYLNFLRGKFNNSIQYVAAYNLGHNAVKRMLNKNDFTLGKVQKYVVEIHTEAKTLRGKSSNFLANAY